MREYNENKETCGTICLKYLLFIFNFFFWLAGGAVMAVGIWTLIEKSDYISLLQSNTYMATAYILVVAGVVVMITGILGCCATFREQRNLLRAYFILLLCIFLLEIIAGTLAYIYYRQLSTELKQNLKDTMTQKYRKPGEEGVTNAVDKLQQEGGCITKLENFIQEHLKIIGAVGIGIACVQIFGMIFTCCLYRSLKAEPY
ncbi:PREDICTED: CD151 antigen [Gekko japonicus]|uniref:Platelet-endothelial tetraspan antigen 3 n=1 Tax=Gekko japonicus TaxID=146911 RepID=A0ABM1JXD5_GEKJA|nr:PREDICTED: CD151 antigen [Gekko japonicus]